MCQFISLFYLNILLSQLAMQINASWKGLKPDPYAQKSKTEFKVRPGLSGI